jgi:uncharacterized membrane protein YhhN
MAAAMRIRTIDLIFLAALLVGLAYFGLRRFAFDYSVWSVALKGACVALMAAWAGLQARTRDGWLIAAVLALGALGDVLIETHGLNGGAIAFLAGHVVAIWLYLRNRTASLWPAVLVALAVTAIAWWLPAARGLAGGIALYSLGLGAMAGTALTSRFARDNVGLGALLFVASDLLIFAQIGPLHGSVLPGLLIWPLYVAGQAAIAWGVVTRLRQEGAA